MKLTQRDGVQLVDSETVAIELEIEHRALIQTIDKYLSQIETSFGLVTFEMLPDSLGRMNTPKRVAYLNEGQAILIATLSRNTEQVVRFKTRLVQAFYATKQLINAMSPAEMKLHVFKMLEQEAESLKEQLKLAEQTIKAQSSKVEYHDKVLDSTGLIPSTVVAVDFGLTPQKLHNTLKSRGILWKVGGTWVPTAKYKDQGFLEIKPYVYKTSTGQERSKNQSYWTEKGRHFLHSILNH